MASRTFFGPPAVGIVLLVVAAGGTRLGAQESRPSDSYSWLGSLGDNLRATLDLSSRVMYSARSGEPSAIQAIGFDVLKVFSGECGDIATVSAQGYLLRLDNVNPHPPFVEDDDDWEFTWRLLNVNYTGLAGGRFNLRAGVFEIPYGLEHPINTNGTLRDFINEPDLGLKKDIGVSVNGSLPAFDYELALTRGSGMEWHANTDPYAISGRISTPQEQRIVLGLSGFHGETFNQGGVGNTTRTRVGIDAQLEFGAFALLGEVSAGEDESREVVNTITELDWYSAEETWFVYLQHVLLSGHDPGGWNNNQQAILGAEWRIDGHWTLSAQVTQDLHLASGSELDTVSAVQIRFRF